MPSPQLTTPHSPLPAFFLLCALCVSAVNAFSSPALAGDLNPPAGPITPTQRTPIGAATTPGDADSLFRITQPGSYYLTANITGVAAKHAIQIDSPNVTLDLNGFALIGVPSTLDAVNGGPSADALSIRNGTISDWGDDALDLGATGIGGFLIDHLAIENCDGNSITLFFCAVISDCTISGGRGISVNCCSIVQRCRIGSISTSTTAAISASQSCTILDNHFHNCEAGVINVAEGSLIERNTIVHGGNSAFDTIRVGVGCTVRNNVIATNAAAAQIHAQSDGNRIEANHISGGATRGIDVDTNGNITVRNSVRGAVIAYDIVAGNMTGPIITPATIAANTNPDANYAP